MKTVMKTMLAAAFLMSTGSAIAGHGETGDGQSHNKGRHHGPSGMQATPMVKRLVRALHQLDLSDEQKEDIHAVMQQLKSDVRSVMEETKAGHMQLKHLIKAPEYDETAVAELAAKEGELAAERLVMTSRAMAEVLGYLTDEQRTELENMASERKHHRNEKHQRRSAEG